MTARDFSLLFGICFVWGANIVFTRWVIADAAVAPMFFAALRFALVALLLLPFLRPVPKKMGQLFFISLCIGAAHFGLLFHGLQTAQASAVAIVTQLSVPFSTILSMVVLGERVRWRRGFGIALSFVGVMVIAVEPGGFSISIGLVYVLAAVFVGSCAGILMKRIDPMPALQLQAWVGVLSFLPLALMSLAWEANQVSSFVEGGVWVWAATLFGVVGVAIFGHGSFYTLLKKYDVSLLSPLTLMTPIWGLVLGIWLLGEPLTARLLVGSAIALSGVAVIAVRPNMKLPVAALGRKLFQ